MEPETQAHFGRAATLVVAILIPVNVIDVRVEHAALVVGPVTAAPGADRPAVRAELG